MTSWKERSSRNANGGRSVYDFSADLLDGRTIRLADFKGTVLLIVNTASQCGFTPQYAGLEELYRTKKERGLRGTGVPLQSVRRAGTRLSQEIANFCKRNYGVSFPIFAKIDVNGPMTHPLYRFLKQRGPGCWARSGSSGTSQNSSSIDQGRWRTVLRLPPTAGPGCAHRRAAEQLTAATACWDSCTRRAPTWRCGSD